MLQKLSDVSINFSITQYISSIIIFICILKE